MKSIKMGQLKVTLGILALSLTINFPPASATVIYSERIREVIFVSKEQQQKNSIQQFPSPPPHEKVAEMARYIVTVSNWTSIATISTREPTVGFPFSNIVSVSDGPIEKSTGVPYMYVTGLDVTSIDLKKDNRATLSMTLAQSDYCRVQDYDPEDPRCARVILSGRVVKLQNGTAEAEFAKQAVFSRHPSMAFWPSDHGFVFAKLDISSILVLDYFGGAVQLAPKDYFKANKRVV